MKSISFPLLRGICKDIFTPVRLHRITEHAELALNDVAGIDLAARTEDLAARTEDLAARTEDLAARTEDLAARTEAAAETESYIRSIREQLQSFLTQNKRLPLSVSFSDGLACRIELLSPGSSAVSGKLVLITGAAQGIGAGIARAMVAEGAHVCLADLNTAKAELLAEELGYGQAWALGMDVTDNDSQQEAVCKVLERFGGLDILISNAGITRAGSVDVLSNEDFLLSMQVNYQAFFLLVKHFSPIMKFQHQANASYSTDIIQINSKSGLQGSAHNSAYAGSKFGGIGLCQSFALELVEHYIKVNAVCPGNFFDGPMWSDPEKGLFIQYMRAGKVPGAKTVDDVRNFYIQRSPLGRVLQRGCRIDDIVQAIHYIVSQQYETGQAIPVSGGQVLLS